MMHRSRYNERIRSHLSGAAMLVAAFLSASPSFAQNEIYDCEVAKGIDWDSGDLSETERSKAFTALVKGFVFDSTTAVLRTVAKYDGSLIAPLEFKIVQLGNTSDSDLVAENPLEHSLLRIRTWQQPMAFVYFDSQNLWAGHCKPLALN